MKTIKYSNPFRQALASDSGMALAVVMLMSAIMFLLATTVLTLVSYRERATAATTDRNQAMHLADAGINEYVYQLSQSYDYWKTHQQLGPVTTEGGSGSSRSLPQQLLTRYDLPPSAHSTTVTRAPCRPPSASRVLGLRRAR